MRDCRLECVQAVIERQKRMPAEANDDRLFLDRQHRRSRFLWSRPSVHDRAARLPLAHRLLIDAVTSGERSQALFTMLYRSTDRLSRRGAPVKNLAHSASFDSCNKNAPSKCGTKQLGFVMPAPVLHLGANVRCSHNGVATPVAGFQRVLVFWQPIVTVSTAYVITGCTLVGTPSPPCWTGRWLTGATRVIAGGVPVVTLPEHLFPSRPAHRCCL